MKNRYRMKSDDIKKLEKYVLKMSKQNSEKKVK